MVKVRTDMTGWKMWEHGVPDSRIIVLKQTEDHVYSNGKRRAQWLCECNCKEHNKFVAVGADIRRGFTKSCGCLLAEWGKQAGKNSKKYNKYDLSGEYGIGWTSNTNEEFYFDLEDYDKIKDYCWFADNHNKSKRVVARIDDKNMFMHALLGYKNYDHIDRNELNNRKNNLRPCTRQENSRNRGVVSNNTSGFTGVCWDNTNHKWKSYISLSNKKQVRLGYFIDKEEAIKVRLQAEAKYYGEFAPQRHLFEEYGIRS